MYGERRPLVDKFGEAYSQTLEEARQQAEEARTLAAAAHAGTPESNVARSKYNRARK